MQRYIFILIIFVAALQVNAQQKKVLFLGNSYTAANGSLPTILSEICSSMGDNIYTDRNTPGGYRLKSHSTNSTSVGKILSENWDYVVMQEQSQIPSFPPGQVDTMCYPYAEQLCDTIRYNDSCTRPMFFMTWGRKNGDDMNCASYPPVCTYEGMQGRLRASYLEMGYDNNAEVAPVGMVWKAIREDFPGIELYTADESHPSINGSYLAACVFYTSIYYKSAIGAYFPSGVDPQDAANIQNYAGNIVLDSTDIWNIDTTTVRAYFTPWMATKSISGGFNNLSSNTDSSYWTFGDGTDTMQYDIATSPGISHIYQNPGSYYVCLTSYGNCDFNKYCDTINTSIFTGLDDKHEDQEYFYFDYSNNEFVFSDKLAGKRLWIYDISGRLIGTETLYSGNILDKYKGVVIVKLAAKSEKVLKLDL